MTFGWAYPPGVTGRELEINGPDVDTEIDKHCEGCGSVTTHSHQTYQSEWWDECSECGHQTNGYFDEDDDRDWDAIAEARRDAQLDARDEEREWGGLDI